MGGVNCAQVLANVLKDGFHHWPELESDTPPESPPVRPPTLPPDFPDIHQNPYSELQPPPDPGATADKVAGMMPAATEPETLKKKMPVAPEASYRSSGRARAIAT